MGGAEWISDCGKARLILGDCLERLRELPDCSVDSVVTDPPYGLAFMGKKWDYDVPAVEVWAECLRVLKPGGHLLAFAGTRTQHRMAVRIEDAGFEIRDMIAWVYGSGFPKSMNISKQLDKMAGAEREKKRVKPRPDTCGTMAGSSDTRPWIERSREVGYHEVAGDTPITESAIQWNGWGTAIKPAMEPITVARKPLIGTVAENVLRHGTGAINVDGCRVEHDEPIKIMQAQAGGDKVYGQGGRRGATTELKPSGRWPANIIHDGSDEVVGLFPQTTVGSVKPYNRASRRGWAGPMPEKSQFEREGDSGSAARFFYCAKSSKQDRNDGTEGLITWENVDLNQETEELLQLAKDISELITPNRDEYEWSTMLSGSNSTDQFQTSFRFIIETVTRLITELKTCNCSARSNTKGFILDATRMILGTGLSLAESAERASQLSLNTTNEKTGLALGAVAAALKTLQRISEKGKRGNVHNTVKPAALMRYLCRLVTPPGGIVLDPFMGSGSTGKGAILEGFRFIGIEREAEYLEIAKARIAHAIANYQQPEDKPAQLSLLPDQH